MGIRKSIDDRYRTIANIRLDGRAKTGKMRISRIEGRARMSKTLSFAALHFTVAFAVGWLLTGNWMIGGALALVEPACNTVVFHFHEKVWKRIEARRADAPTRSRATRWSRDPAARYFFFGMYRSVMLPS